jgi:hypothetical protein
MAAGLVTINFIDGGGTTRTGRFFSSDGTASGLLYPAPVLTDTAGTPVSPALESTQSSILTALSTPAASLPPPAPVASGNTTFTKFVANISSATTTEIVAAVSGQKTRLHKGFLVIAGANVLTFKRGSTAISGPLTFGSNGGFIYFNDDVYPEMTETAANEALNLTTTTTAAVGGVLQTVTSA